MKHRRKRNREQTGTAVVAKDRFSILYIRVMYPSDRRLARFRHYEFLMRHRQNPVGGPETPANSETIPTSRGF